jgi:hypothetical protein
MKRFLVWTMISAVVLACGLNVGPLGAPKLVLTPVLDTMFLGDQLVKRQVTFIDAHGNVQDPGPVAWSTRDTSIVSVDPATGKITALAPGNAVVLADAQTAEGFAVIVVTPLLKVTMLVDTNFAMPGDTFTVPVDVHHEAPGVPTVWFSATANAAFAIDSASGLVTANAVGGPFQIVAHAALGADTVTDPGTVEVLQLADTAGGGAYYTIFGTVQRARRVSVRGSIYSRPGGVPTLRLTLQTLSGAVVEEKLDIVLVTPPADAATIAVDSISIAEIPGGSVDPFCHPPGNWSAWFTLINTARLVGLSRNGGNIIVSQVVTVPHGLIMSGHFYVPEQRTDRYDDPTAVLPIHGSFVTPVITDPSPCR